MPDPDTGNPLDEETLPALELSDAEVDALVSTLAPRVQKENERINKELTLLAERTQVATNATGAMVALLTTDALVCRGRSGPAASPQGTKLDRNTGLAGESVRTGGILLCEDCETDERVDAASCRATGTRSILVVPLYHNGEVIGILEALSGEPQAFGYEDIAVLQTMAEMAVNAVIPPVAQRQQSQTNKATPAKAEIISSTPPGPAGSAQPVGIDLSKLIVEPEAGRPAALEFPPAPKKPTTEEVAPFHDPEDDLICELGPQEVTGLLQTGQELEEPQPELTLFHPAGAQEPKRPVISRKLVIVAAAVIALALMWLRFCSRAPSVVPQEQSWATPSVETAAEMVLPIAAQGVTAKVENQSRFRRKPWDSRAHIESSQGTFLGGKFYLTY